MRPHHKLDVWRKSIDFVTEIYDITKKLPKDETFGLVSQMRRAAISIPSNIAEGAGRTGKKEFNNFLSIALGSALELETQLIISERLGYLSDGILNNMLEYLTNICKMLTGLKKSLRIK